MIQSHEEYVGVLITLGAETFANFAQIRESLRRLKFYIDRFAKVYAREIFQFFLFFSLNLLTALDNALILVSWSKNSRCQCNTKTRSASYCYLSVRKMFGARKRGLIRRKLEIIRFFSLFYFYLDSNVSLKQQKKSTFMSIRESLRREKLYFGRFAKVYAREMQKFREFFRSRKFLLLSELLISPLHQRGFLALKSPMNIVKNGLLLLIFSSFKSFKLL